MDYDFESHDDLSEVSEDEQEVIPPNPDKKPQIVITSKEAMASLFAMGKIHDEILSKYDIIGPTEWEQIKKETELPVPGPPLYFAGPDEARYAKSYSDMARGDRTVNFIGMDEMNSSFFNQIQQLEGHQVDGMGGVKVGKEMHYPTVGPTAWTTSDLLGSLLLEKYVENQWEVGRDKLNEAAEHTYRTVHSDVEKSKKLWETKGVPDHEKEMLKKRDKVRAVERKPYDEYVKKTVESMQKEFGDSRVNRRMGLNNNYNIDRTGGRDLFD